MTFSFSLISRRFIFSGLLGCGALLCALPSATQAQIPISLASSTGNASTQTAAYHITPSAGTQQFLLTTINPASALPTDGSLGTTSALTNVTTLNTYFGLGAGVLAGRGIQDGSGYLTQQVTLTVGSVVRFDYLYLTNEDNTASFNNDQAFFTVNGVINSTLYTAAQATTPTNPLVTTFNLQSNGPLTSGYTQGSYVVPATGNYTFGFGVGDVTTNTVYSGLLIDNINYSVVPEPGTTTLLVLGLGGSLLAARRRRPH